MPPNNSLLPTSTLARRRGRAQPLGFRESEMDELKGAIAALASSLLAAILFAFVFRVPIPFGGYIGPFGEFSTYNMGAVDVIRTVSFAWAFYGILGGFIVLSLSGVLVGTLVGQKYSGSEHKNRMIILWAIGIGTALVFLMAILDFIIGPW